MSDNLLPFIKCPGGKRKLVPLLLEVASRYRWTEYWEPMIGGGALFLAISKLFTPETRSLISDADHDLVSIWRAIRERPDALHTEIEALLLHHNASPHPGSVFLEARDRWNEGFAYPAEVMYLRMASFNGIWRLSQTGRHNVPWNKKTKITIPSLDAFRDISRALQNTTVVAKPFLDLQTGPMVQSFVSGKRRATPLVYLDPPYDGTFTGYNAVGFSDLEQEALLSWCGELERAGAKVIYSNADTEKIRAMMARYWPTAIVQMVTNRQSIAATGKARNAKQPEILAHSP